MNSPTRIQLPGETGGRRIEDMINFTPKQRVFGTLRLLIQFVEDSDDLNEERDRLIRSLGRALSWEACLADCEPREEQEAPGLPGLAALES